MDDRDLLFRTDEDLLSALQTAASRRPDGGISDAETRVLSRKES
jgi:hypothetical protein